MDHEGHHVECLSLILQIKVDFLSFILPGKGRKALVVGALPTINLPERSHQAKLAPARRPLTIVNQNAQNTTEKDCYKNFKELCERTKKLKLPEWQQECTSEKLVLKLSVSPLLIPKFEIIIEENFHFTCVVYGWVLASNHSVYGGNKRSLKNITVSELLQKLTHYCLCHGISEQTAGSVHHAIPCRTNIDQEIQESAIPMETVMYHRPKECLVLYASSTDTTKCTNCLSFEKKLTKQKTIKSRKLNVAAKANAPVSTTHPHRLKLALQQQRLKCTQLEGELTKMRQAIQKSGVVLQSEFSQDVRYLMSGNKEKLTPFMKLFWQQQQEAFTKSPNAIRYHPMIIRFCLSLAAKSASAYEELRNSKVLTLPSRRTLRDYRNVIAPSIGFNPALVQELCQTTKSLTGIQRFVVLAFDEMKVQSKLVFNKNTGDLVGFLDLGDPDINFTAFDDAEELASHALVFYIRGIASDLKFNLAYFATGSLKSYQLMPLFWKAVAILELTCSLPVIVAASDGASANRKFYRMHAAMDKNAGKSVVYRTVNVYATDRFIWLFADAPHLMKTARNCLYHSSTGKSTRCMWNDGKYLLWQHICTIVNDDAENGLKLCPKLSCEHTRLTSYSVMNVRLAGQVLSETTGKILKEYHSPDMHGTAEFCLQLDKFFDCLNVRSREEGNFKRKDAIKPYTSHDDERLKWLENTFLKYLADWKKSTEDRPGNFSPTDRQKMFLSLQTYEGLQMTVYSVIEVTKFLLSKGMTFVLTNRFNQDVVEEYFGRQRSLGRRSDNPNIWQFGFNDNIIRTQRSVAPVTGNTEGRHDKKRKVSWTDVDETPLKRRQKNKSV